MKSKESAPYLFPELAPRRKREAKDLIRNTDENIRFRIKNIASIGGEVIDQHEEDGTLIVRVQMSSMAVIGARRQEILRALEESHKFNEIKISGLPVTLVRANVINSQTIHRIQIELEKEK